MGSVNYVMKHNLELYLGDILIYFNIAGIVTVILASILIRRMLVKMHLKLD